MTISSRLRPLSFLTATLLVALAGLAWWAPASAPPLPPAADAALAARLFPGVPASWILLRLVVTVAAIAATARLAFAAAWNWPERPHPAAAEAAPSFVVPVALGLALGHAALWPWVRQAPLLLQGTWTLASVLPVLPLAFGAQRRGERDLVPGLQRFAWLAPVALWFVWRVLLAPDRLRLADTVDTWLGLERARTVAEGAVGLFGDAFLAGAPNTYMVLEGVPFFSLFGAVPTATSMTVVHGLWWAMAAALLGDVVGRRSGGILGCLAAAALLFSPFALHTNVSMLPIFLGPLATASFVWLIDRRLRDGSLWPLALAGPLVGLSLGVPALVPIAGIATLTFLWDLRARERRLRALAIFLLPLLSLAWPAVPNAATVGRMVADYTTGSGVWVILERALMGQVAPAYVVEGWHAGAAPLLDVPLAALLSPWLAARTPMRAWGDNLYDPLTAVAFAVGLLLALRESRRRPEAAWLVAALALVMAPGLLSSYDRPSHTRMLCAPVLWAIFAAAGIDALSRLVAERPRARALVAWTLVAGVLAVGLFDVADARRLERSFLSVAIETAAATNAPALVVRHGQPGDLSWLHFDRIAEALAPPNLALVDAREAAAALAVPGALFVSPGLEQAEGVVGALCRQVPEATVLVVEDVTGHSRALVVTGAPGQWRSARRGEEVSCVDWPGGIVVPDRGWAR